MSVRLPASLSAGRRIRTALLSLLVACLGSESQANEPEPAPALASGRYAYKMIVGPHERRYVVNVPACCDGRTPLPMVVALHGAGSSAESFIEYTNWASCSESRGFILLAPEGLPLNPGAAEHGPVNIRVWNSGQFGPHYPTSRVDDETFVIAAMDSVMSAWPIDRGRVYIAGHSSGGAMAFRLVNRRAERFTAMASVSGFGWDPDPRPARSVPTLVVIGNLDPVVPKHGGLKILPWEIHPSPPVNSVMSRWAAAIGCPPAPVTVGETADRSVRYEDYGPGETGGLLRVVRLKHQGHAWPGGGGLRFERLLGPDLTDYDATESIWAFFVGWAG